MKGHVVVHNPWYVTLVRLVIAVLLVAGIFATCAGTARAEDLRKGSKGLFISSDCDEEICTSYAIQVSKRFVRLPLARQIKIVQATCHQLDVSAEEYEDTDGNPWRVQSCVFQYNQGDIAYWTNDGRVLVEPWYVAALAALRN